MRRLFPTPAAELGDDALLAEAASPRDGSASGSFVRFSMVSSLDGRISVDGVSAPLSSAADQRRFLLLRAASDAVVVGSGTATAEGYRGELLPAELRRLRESRGLPSRPWTVVLSASASLPADAPVLTDAPADTFVVVAEDAAREKVAALRRRLGSEAVITVPVGARPAEVTAALAARGAAHLHHEGGPRVLNRYLSEDAVDSLCLTVAPALLMAGELLTGEQLRPTVRRAHLHLLYEEDSFLLADYRLHQDAGAGPAETGGEATA